MARSDWQLAALMDGYVATQLLYVAAKLGIPEALSGGPRDGREVAATVGADTLAITRVLRGLAVEGVVDERDDGRFGLTALGESLHTMRGQVIARGELYYQAAAGLLDAVRTGTTAFERVHGERFFEHLEGHPDRAAVFQESMAARSEREARDVVAAYDFGGVRRLVDVGGGRGILLAAILRAAPALRGVLLDRPARSRRRAGVSTPTASATAPSAWPATSSPRCRTARTPTCCRASCTTGTTPTLCASSPPAAPRCGEGARLLVVEAILPRACEGGAGRDPHGPAHADAARRVASGPRRSTAGCSRTRASNCGA